MRRGRAPEGQEDRPSGATAAGSDLLHVLARWQRATTVLPDSGGIQGETTALGMQCLTLRANPKRAITVSEGCNSIVGADRVLMLAAVRDILSDGGKAGRIPEFRGGRAAERIVAILED